MLELLNRYIYIFLHPFQIHQEFRDQRKLAAQAASNVLPFTGGLGVAPVETPVAEEEDDSPGFSRAEGIAISWVFAIIMGMYEIFAINLSLISYEYISEDTTLASILMETYSRNSHGITLFFTLMNVVFFPVAAWLYLKFWEVMIRFFAQVYDVEDDTEEIIEGILSCSLTSHFLLIIPIFGTMAHYTANLIYLFAGLKNNMGLTNLQSIIVLVSPLFLMLLFVFLIFFSIFTLFGMM